MTGRERVAAHLAGETVDRLPLMPITMMFAAGQTGVSYRKYVTDHETLAQAQHRTARTFGFDHVSVISDPAREAHDLGARIEWFEHQPPAIVESEALLAAKERLGALKLPDPRAGRMGDRVAGVRRLRELAGAELCVEGWVEGPCAMAADLRGLNSLLVDLHDDADYVRELFAFCVAMEIGFAEAQLEAGADYIGVGDAAASLVGPRYYRELVLPFEEELVAGIHARGGRVRLHICGNTRKIAAGMGSLGAAIVDLDSLTPLELARAEMPSGQVLAGNIDPVRVLRDGTPEQIQAALAECHRQAGARWIVAAGCEVPPGTPAENVRAMAAYAHTHLP
jgi:MtaA/CmuA family methyltransferase